MRRIGIAAVLLLTAAFLIFLLARNPAAPNGDLERAADPRSAVEEDPPAARLRGAPPDGPDEAARDPKAPSPPAVLRVPVVDDAGRPVPGARVRVHRPSFSMFGGRVTEVEVVADAQGIAAVPDRGEEVAIPHEASSEGAGIRFTVSVHPPDDRGDLAPLEGAPWPPRDPLALPPGGAVAGRVVDPSQRGLADVAVMATVGGRPFGRVRTDAEGGFRIESLPLGRHALAIDVPGMTGAFEKQRWPAETGSFDLRVEVEVGESLRVHPPEGWPEDDATLLVAPSDGDEGRPGAPRLVRRLPVTVHGLSADRRYTLHAVGSVDGRVGWAAFVSPHAGEVRLAARTARAVEGTLALPPPPLPRDLRGPVQIEARVAGLVLPGVVRREGEVLPWRVEGLPQGEAVAIFAWIGRREDPAAGATLPAAGEAGNVLHLRARTR